MLVALSFCLVSVSGCASKNAAQKTLQAHKKQVQAARVGSDRDSASLEASIDVRPYIEPDHSRPLPQTIDSPKIEISKKQRRLYLFSGDKLLRAYPVKLGLNPYEDKVAEGDWCTPEGRFYICTKNPKSKFNLSLGLSYPNIEDAERGLASNLINKQQYNEIVRKISMGGIPPWDTPLGGQIFIHGDGEYWGATYGCVALNNKDINELYSVLRVGTEVVIRK